jgi:aminoglycoside 6'-N-acetyltransferase
VVVTFRPLTDVDLPMLHHWLNEPGVVRWWEGDDVSWEGVVRDYGSAATDAAEYWIASVDGTDVGWIQCYPTAEEPEECEPWWALGVDRSAAGIDYLIGDPGDRGRGVGSAMIRAFLAEVVFGLHPGWSQACAAPYAANVASWRALEKAGFRFVGIVEDKDGPCRLMVADRPADEDLQAGPHGLHPDDERADGERRAHLGDGGLGVVGAGGDEDETGGDAAAQREGGRRR